MIALSAYKLASYFKDILDTDYLKDGLKPNSMNISWEEVYSLSFQKQESSRNNVFLCLGIQEKEFAFKQSKAFTKGNLQDIRSEAEFYRIKSSLQKVIVPELFYFDDYNSILITKFISELKHIDGLSSSDYQNIGQALKEIHDNHLKPTIDNSSLQWIRNFRVFIPSVLDMTVVEKQALKHRGNPYMNQLLSYLESKTSEISQWKEEWHSASIGLIHGDARAANFRFIKGQMGQSLQIVLLDFEYVSFGAWFWDLAVFTTSLLDTTNLPTATASVNSTRIKPKAAGKSPFDVYPRIKKFCLGYGVNLQQDRQIILRWAGIYLLDRFIHSQNPRDLQDGLDLIEQNVFCSQKIFV